MCCAVIYGAWELCRKQDFAAHHFTNGSNKIQISIDGFNTLSIASPRMVITINSMYFPKNNICRFHSQLGKEMAWPTSLPIQSLWQKMDGTAEWTVLYGGGSMQAAVIAAFPAPSRSVVPLAGHMTRCASAQLAQACASPPAYGSCIVLNIVVLGS